MADKSFKSLVITLDENWVCTPTKRQRLKCRLKKWSSSVVSMRDTF